MVKGCFGPVRARCVKVDERTVALFGIAIEVGESANGVDTAATLPRQSEGLAGNGKPVLECQTRQRAAKFEKLSETLFFERRACPLRARPRGGRCTGPGTALPS